MGGSVCCLMPDCQLTLLLLRETLLGRRPSQRGRPAPRPKFSYCTVWTSWEVKL